MNRRRPSVREAIAVLVLLLISGSVEARAGEVPISLDAAVREAIAGNLDLRVESFSPALSETDLLRARAIYDPMLELLLDHRGTKSAFNPTSSFQEERTFFDANLSADVLLSSGATASASFTNLWSRDNFGTPLSRYAQPQFSLSLSQPVLRGFGKEVTEKAITVAGYDRASALLQWRSVAIDTAAAARDAYFALVKARENLETRRASLAVAKEIHAGNRARVKAGVLAEVELLDSEFGVAQREEGLLTAEKNVRDSSDGLAVLIQHGIGSELVPLDPIPVDPVEHSEASAIETALRDRPDLQRERVTLKSREFQTKVARNAALPDLSLIGSAGIEGLAPEYGAAFDDLVSGESPFWSVGVSLSLPIRNRAAKADLAASRLRERQEETRIRSLEEKVRLEVRNAIRALDTSYRQIDVARKGVSLGEARLASFLKRGKVGLAVTRDILEAELDLTAAREALTAARVDYQGAVTRLWKATGELLERQRIRIEDPATEHLARKELR